LHVAEFAAGRHRVIHARELRAFGISQPTITRWVARGRLRREHQGVYVYGNGALTMEGRLYAAAVAIGDDAVVSHVSAAVLHGFWPYSLPAVVDLTVPRQVRSRRRIRIHQVSAVPPLTTHLGIPVTTAARTVRDLAATMYSDKAFRRVVHEAQVQEKVTIEQLQREARTGRPGTPRLAAEIADGAKPTRSGFEDWAVQLLRRHGFPPFQTNVHPPGTPDWVEVDVLFPAEKLVVEVDGDRFHSTPFRREFDARKQVIVEEAGYRVLRLDDGDAQPEREADVVARVRRELLQVSR
jgi:very-short-patch-repair endonuclease